MFSSLRAIPPRPLPLFDETVPLLNAESIEVLEVPGKFCKVILPTNNQPVACDSCFHQNMEHGGHDTSLYQPLDLQIWPNVRHATVRKDYLGMYAFAVRQDARRKKVATKSSARGVWGSNGVHVDRIKLKGSMEELAILTGVPDAIVTLIWTTSKMR